MDKIYLNPEQYDTAVEAYRDKYGYDEMSDEEKEAFDDRLDQVLGVDEDENEPVEETESTDADGASESDDQASDMEKLKNEIRSEHGYDDMSDEEKEAFDERLDQVVGQEETEDEEPDQPEKVLRLTR